MRQLETRAAREGFRATRWSCPLPPTFPLSLGVVLGEEGVGEEGDPSVTMDSVVKTVCPYCGVGCGLVAKVRDGRIVEVRGDKEHPSTRGGICNKGAQAGQIVQ